MNRSIRRMRILLYRAGVRPKTNSVWFSPTLHIHYAFRAMVRDALKNGNNNAPR